MATPLELDITGLDVQLTAMPLEPSAFAPFGDVIENPRPDVHPSSAFLGSLGPSASSLPYDAVPANQGTAIKYQHVTRPTNLYWDGAAPSGRPGIAVVNMFVCAARQLETLQTTDSGTNSGSGAFTVKVLERHPFTTQTFIPLSASGRRTATHYLVVVAPSLPPSAIDEGFPVPIPDRVPVPRGNRKLPGRGLPDVRHLRAFVASTGQAVTYGAGTWHAPMVALGEPGTSLDFVVTQFANGVADEDCQEIVFTSAPVSSSSSFYSGASLASTSEHGGGRIVVRVPNNLKTSRL
ncbi:hypothetical protein VTK73DRAFT_3944 [Phialemonium thermophilum]|uniref:Ureidoglycolate hydrolase n=1 Tax=Phialemonium thermophilum TaxID=223376 RepID=A0ABR3Y0L5_9PEZI